ncbi:polysaccharide deacetylase [Spirochaetia bacterium]|nr:polysaccharide deacetylase [Spirochaetia bacterium]
MNSWFKKTGNEMKNRKGLYYFLFSLGLSLFSAGTLLGLSFSGLDLSDDNRLLFRSDSGAQHTLYVSRLTDLALQQITAFPENLELVENGRVILVRNRFGAARIPVAGGLPLPVPGFPSFAGGTVPPGGRLEELAASADGRWILFVEPTSAAYGNLALLETASGVKRVISQKIERPARDFPVRWSPDSRLFVYAKGGRLFYFPMIHDLAAVADERYRQIGEGEIDSVSWGQQGDFFYFKGNTLYRVRSPELFTRTIYGDFLSIGSVAGRLPLDFDPNFDRFWIAPDARSLLLLKNGKNIFYFPLDDNTGGDSILPYVMIPQGAFDVNVLWSSSGLVTVIASVLGHSETMAWRFEIDGRSVTSFAPLETPAGSRCALSPDGTRALFWGDSGLALWDYVSWRPLQIISREPVLSCVWLNSAEFIVGNSRLIEGISVSGQRRLICLAGADEFGFEEGDSARLLAKNSAGWFASNGKNPWALIANPRLKKASLVSGRYRVYLEPQSAGPFDNLPMIRNTASVGTTALLPAARQVQSAESGEIALCFDLYDDDTGLSQVMDALRHFNAKATFFLNGDFIRRNPAAAAAIAEAGYEIASLFYAPIDLADSRYRVSPEYIAQGLARNEDEFFESTGKELKLLWHPPFYRTSPEISAAASAAGYQTAVRDVDSGDWLSRDEARRFGIHQHSVSNMIERIMDAKKPGAVIPVRLGLLPGGRDDYLFLRIEVLMDALVRAGYTIVPVSKVIQGVPK